MNILFWTELFFPHIGGIEVFGAQLIKELSRFGHRIKVVASHSGVRIQDISEHEGVEIHRFHFQRALVRKNLQEIKRISEKIIRFKKEFRPDVVHVNTIQPSLFFFYQTRTYHPASTLLTLHQPPAGSSGGSSLFHNAASCSDWITAVSNNLLSKAIEYVPEIEYKSSVLYNGLESPPSSPSPINFNPPTILCMGRLIRDKGFDLALTSFKQIIKIFPKANLIIAGDGPQRKELEESAVRHGIRHAVQFTGWIPPDKVYEVIDKASLLAAPSRWEEPFCLAALQAGQMGRPVVASRTGGIPEIILDNKTGLLFEKENPKDLSGKILFLIRNPLKSVEMGKRAMETAALKFDIKVIAKKYDLLYKKLFNKKKIQPDILI